VASGAAYGLAVHSDNKGSMAHSVLFYLGLPEEMPLFL